MAVISNNRTDGRRRNRELGRGLESGGYCVCVCTAFILADVSPRFGRSTGLAEAGK